ncbi:hypothetical protein N9L06_01010 [Mariniblastus sp.]|nr:hypothetical protein [Mariniblastus sp.]
MAYLPRNVIALPVDEGDEFMHQKRPQSYLNLNDMSFFYKTISKTMRAGTPHSDKTPLLENRALPIFVVAHRAVIYILNIEYLQQKET